VFAEVASAALIEEDFDQARTYALKALLSSSNRVKVFHTHLSTSFLCFLFFLLLLILLVPFRVVWILSLM